MRAKVVTVMRWLCAGCDRVSTSATCFCLLIVVGVESRQTLLTHILPGYSVRCQCLELVRRYWTLLQDCLHVIWEALLLAARGSRVAWRPEALQHSSIRSSLSYLWQNLRIRIRAPESSSFSPSVCFLASTASSSFIDGQQQASNAQDEVNQEDSEQNEVDWMKKGAD